MAFKNIARQGLRPGLTVRYEIPGLIATGDIKPAFIVELYGPHNQTVIGESILHAGLPVEEPPSVEAPPVTDVEAFARWEKMWETHRARLVKYCIRGVEGFYHDGANDEPDLERPASIDDVPDILNAMPLEMLLALFVFCVTESNFRSSEKRAEVEELAKK